MLLKIDILLKTCYNLIVAQKKGGIIIEHESKNALLRKGLILLPAAILAITLCNSNTLYAQSATATKERIKEIKFVKEDFNAEKLMRGKTKKLASVTSNYLRMTAVTSRNMEVTRIKKQEDTTSAKESKQETVEIQNEQKDIKEEVKNKTKNETEKKLKTISTVKVKSKKKEKKKTNKEKEEKTKNIEPKTETIENTEKIKVSISRGMDLTKRTGLSKEQFKKLIKNVSQDSSKFFYNNADTIYDLCAKYQINEIFFCGLISAESGWNIAGNHRKTHNYVSLMSGGKLIHYSSTSEGLTVAAKTLHNNYLTPKGKFYGGKTLSGVQKKYCPSGSWIGLVYGRMCDVARATKKIK